MQQQKGEREKERTKEWRESLSPLTLKIKIYYIWANFVLYVPT